MLWGSGASSGLRVRPNFTDWRPHHHQAERQAAPACLSGAVTNHVPLEQLPQLGVVLLVERNHVGTYFIAVDVETTEFALVALAALLTDPCDSKGAGRGGERRWPDRGFVAKERRPTSSGASGDVPWARGAGGIILRLPSTL